MRLEEYWGVGPKTREALADELGVEAAVEAIESANVRALVEAGLPRGRATRILRRSGGAEGMEALATRDARSVYKDLVELAADYAVTRAAADRIRVLTPLRSAERMGARLDDVDSAVETWEALDGETRRAVLSAFEAYDSVDGGERAAVEATLALVDAGATDGVFAPLAEPDRDALADAAEALAALDDGRVREGADDELDRLRESLAEVEDMASGATDVIEDVRAGGVRGTDQFREAFVQHVTRETAATLEQVRSAMPGEAHDAADFVGNTLRALTDDLRAAVEEREREVADDLEATVADAREAVDAAVAAVDDAAFHVSLARFALDHELRRPDLVTDRDALAVEGARNLALLSAGEDVQPVTYGLGDHTLWDDSGGPDAPPAGDRVAVVTGANSGGKTTLLETLCQVSLLAQMGLPVPAERAEVGLVDAVVFHRRHASFNAGVLESTLRAIVPPLSGDGRTLMLVDEFEAITEPGSAADLLHGLVTLTVDRDALGAFVTHLADDLEPLPDAARTDGIFAEGLDPDLRLQVDYQPRFGTVGRSTPEFIVSRLLADAEGAVERAGFETLAEAVGQEAVQRTLSDARWSEG